MSQLIFKFPFKTTYKKKDFFVASNNFEAYKLIESWPNWPNKWINIIGPSGCGKTHLSKILMEKIKLISINAEDFNDKINLNSNTTNKTFSPWIASGSDIDFMQEGWCNDLFHASWIHLHWPSSEHVLNLWVSAVKNI